MSIWYTSEIFPTEERKIDPNAAPDPAKALKIAVMMKVTKVLRIKMMLSGEWSEIGMSPIVKLSENTFLITKFRQLKSEEIL